MDRRRLFSCSLGVGAVLLLLAACSSSSGSRSAAADSGPSSTTSRDTLRGAFAFSISGAALYTQVGDCGSPPLLPDGSLAAFGVVLTTAATPTVCAAIASNDTTALEGQPFVLLQVGSSTYTSGGRVDAVPITPGTYAIGFEDVTDDDLCMLSGTGGQALIDVMDFGVVDAGGAVARASAISGAVTLATVSPTEVAGSFTVQLGTWSADGGSIDTQQPTALFGTFDVTSCPGDAGL